MLFEKDKDYNYVRVNIPFDCIIKNFNKIIQLFTKYEENNFMIDFVSYFFKIINDNIHHDYILDYHNYYSVNYTVIFYENINLFFETLNKNLINKFVSNKIFMLLHEDVSEINIKIVKIVIKNLKDIFISQNRKQNSELFNLFYSNFPKFEKCINNIKEWRDIKIFIKSLKQ